MRMIAIAREYSFTVEFLQWSSLFRQLAFILCFCIEKVQDDVWLMISNWLPGWMWRWNRLPGVANYLLIYNFWLLNYVEGSTNCEVKEVLVFFSGADCVHLLGFVTKPTISFLHDQSARFCTASTYDIHLRLPTRYGDNYSEFREAMIMSPKDNDGFGGV